MNEKIHNLKIKNYKKQIFEKYAFLDLSEVLYGEERFSDNEFCISTINNPNINRVEFSIYNAHKSEYENEEGQYSEASSLFTQKLINAFSSNDIIVFSLNYNKEDFGIKCPFEKIKENIQFFTNLVLPIIIHNEQHSVLFALFRSEYSYEVFSWPN